MNINKITITIVLSILTIIFCNKVETQKIKSGNTVEKNTIPSTNQEKLALEKSTKEEETIIHPLKWYMFLLLKNKLIVLRKV